MKKISFIKCSPTAIWIIQGPRLIFLLALITLKDFTGQLELGTKSKIPHYQLAIEMTSICTKKKILESLEKKINVHISVDIQFNMKSMKEYSTKSFKGENEILLERKPRLKKVLETPFAWQSFLEKNIRINNPDDRTVDWIIDPIGNTGKSSFACCYVSKKLTDGIFMKIDNLDRMELSLIKKIESCRLKYHKDPKVLLFYSPRAADINNGNTPSFRINYTWRW